MIASKGEEFGEAAIERWLMVASDGIDRRFVRSKVWQKGVS